MTREPIAALAAAAFVAALLPLGVDQPADAAAAQSAVLKVSPGVVQNGASVANPDRAAVLGIAAFRHSSAWAAPCSCNAGSVAARGTPSSVVVRTRTGR